MVLDGGDAAALTQAVGWYPPTDDALLSHPAITRQALESTHPGASDDRPGSAL